jgi:hypothetical protein
MFEMSQIKFTSKKTYEKRKEKRISSKSRIKLLKM